MYGGDVNVDKQGTFSMDGFLSKGRDLEKEVFLTNRSTITLPSLPIYMNKALTKKRFLNHVYVTVFTSPCEIQVAKKNWKF